MTVIAAVKQDGNVWMGADSAATNSLGQTMPVAGGKIVRRNGMLIGVSGSHRWLSLIRHSPDIPPPPDDGDLSAWFTNTFADALHDLAKAKGILLEDKDHGDDADLNLLIGYRGEIYFTPRGFGTELIARDFHAIGCGGNEAMGALFALRDKSPSNRILTALEACAELLKEIRAPFYVETLMA